MKTEYFFYITFALVFGTLISFFMWAKSMMDWQRTQDRGMAYLLKELKRLNDHFLPK